MNNQQEITMQKLLSMWISDLAAKHRRYQVNHAINRTMRDIELTRREIAEKMAAQRALVEDLMHLRAERNSIQ